MTITTITIKVDEDAAQAFAAAPAEEQRKMELLLSLRLRDLTVDAQRGLQTVMDEIGSQAEAHGMTPQLLESLLNGD